MCICKILSFQGAINVSGVLKVEEFVRRLMTTNYVLHYNGVTWSLWRLLVLVQWHDG